jgi:ribosome-associated protein
VKKFKITTEFITLGQLLKATDIIGSGGEAKFFLLSHDVLVNGERRTERGKKLYHGDHVSYEKQEIYIIHDPKTES